MRDKHESLKRPEIKMNNELWQGRVRRLCDDLGITHPIVQAPMAGGPSTPELAAAVSDAGALGSLGAGYLSPEDIKRDIKKVRSLTEKPFSVNLFIPGEGNGEATVSEKVLDRLSTISIELGVDAPSPEKESLEFTFEDQLQAVLDNDVPVFSFTFGIPGERHMEELLKRNISVIGTATCVEEGALLEEAGCTAVVAQGSEAGGHRGSFGDSDNMPVIGGMSLIPQLSDRLGIPVLGSGGIMDGRGIAAALSLGASGVQMGTAFLGCEESRIPDVWLDALKNSSDTSTILTNIYTGKFARGIKNRFIDEMSGLEDQVPGYPVQHNLTKPIRAAAKSRANPEFMSLWAGQSAPLIKRTNAKVLVNKLVRETREVINGLAGEL